MLGALAAVAPRGRARRLVRHPARVEPAGADPRSSGSPAPASSCRRSRRSAGGGRCRPCSCPSGGACRAGLAARLRGVAGVRDRRRRPIVHAAARRPRTGACSPDADGAASVGHGWASAALTPFVLVARPRAAPSGRGRASPASSPRRGSVRLGDRVRDRDRDRARRASPSSGIATRLDGRRLTREAPRLLP